MQPSSPDPTNSTGQLSSSSQAEEPSMAQSSESLSSTNQPYPLPPYSQTESSVAPPPPLGSYPPGEEEYYKQLAQAGGPITQYRAQLQEKIGEPAKPKRNGWKVIATILAVLVLILATTTTTLLLTRPSVQQTGQTTSPAVATQPVLQETPSPTQNNLTGITATPGSGTTPTPAGPFTNYNAPQPGPSCDPNGGVWTPYPVGVIANIQCGTSITIGARQTRGYLGLQLPGKTFSPTNRIEVTTTLPAIGDTQIDNCVGLVEQNANTGYLAELCNNGQWSIYSIGSSGAIIKTLASNITAAQSSETLDLTFKGTTLTFTIAGDTEVHTVTLSSPLQPVTVGIAVYHTNANWGQTVDNFNYVTQF